MESSNWKELAEKLNDGELAEILKNRDNEMQEKIEAVLSELRKRGLEPESYPEVQGEIRDEDFEVAVEKPILYSQQVIYLFSVFFSVVFGGILLARNMKEVGSKNGMAHVILFSIIYSFFSMYVLEMLKLGLAGTVFMASVGALILNTAFWNKYIGRDIDFIRKSYRKPLIIGLAVFIPLTLLSVYLTIVTKQ